MSERSDIIDIVAPSFGESVTSAIIARWNAPAGAAVKKDEVLAELETEKIAIVVASPADGRLAEIIAEVGQTIEAGAVLARVVPIASAAAVPNRAPQPALEARPVGDRLQGVGAQTSSAPLSSLRSAVARTEGAQPRSADSPVPHGQSKSVASPSAGKRERLVRMTPLRQAVAKRLKQAQNEAVILSTFNEADMTAILDLREKYAASFQARHGVKLGFMSFFVRACVCALKDVPEVNTEVRGNDLVFKGYYDIGVAVGTERGLVVPVVRNADAMSLAELEKSIGNLGAKARDGTLGLADLQGGTFTISNGGVYGSLMSTPILNAPQTGILGMHNIQQRPVVVDGQVTARPMMYLALSYDHRVVDGRQAVTFLARVKERVEAPQRLLLDM